MDAFVERVLTDLKWAGAPEFCLLANYLNIRIAIYMFQPGHNLRLPDWSIHEPFGTNADTRTITLVNILPYHYNYNA